MLPDALQQLILDRSYLTFTTEELPELIGNDMDAIRAFGEKFGDTLMFLDPPSIDDRMVNQFALFSFTLNPDTNILDWLCQHPALYKKVIIPAGLKWEIRDKLDQANITERIIYPGLDGICRWLQRWYSEKREEFRWYLDQDKGRPIE
jgi:hypothetical protein